MHHARPVRKVSGKTTNPGEYGPMSESGHRSCKCGAVYRRTESMANSRQVASFECEICGETLETWNTAWVPSYRLIVGPTRTPE
jgi:predicted SprT family Zn-dependent metalloprotease